MSKARRAAPRMVMAAALIAQAACYGYVPVTPDTPEPGSHLRVALNEQGASQLTSVLGPEVVELDGRLLAREDQTLSLLVSSYQTRRNAELAGTGDPVHVSIDQITRVEQKRLAPGRSILLGLALAGGAFVLNRLFPDDPRVVESEDPGDPGPQERRRTPRGAWGALQIRFQM